jgi:hypothetical protein
MANRRGYQFTYSSVANPFHVFAKVTFGSTGAPTLTANPYISSITRNSAGDYTIVFRDLWSSLLGVNVIFNSGSSLPTAPAMSVKADNVATATGGSAKSIEIVFSDLETPAGTDPASGEIALLDFVLKNSSVTY